VTWVIAGRMNDPGELSQVALYGTGAQFLWLLRVGVEFDTILSYEIDSQRITPADYQLIRISVTLATFFSLSFYYFSYLQNVCTVSPF
jgi:hypothetical protein